MSDRPIPTPHDFSPRAAALVAVLSDLVDRAQALDALRDAVDVLGSDAERITVALPLADWRRALKVATAPHPQMPPADTSAAEHRPWCSPPDCMLLPGGVEGHHVGPASVLAAEDTDRVAVRLVESLGEHNPAEVLGVRVQVSERGLRGEKSATADLTRGEVLELAARLLEHAAEAERLGGAR